MGYTLYEGWISVRIRDVYHDEEWQGYQDLQAELESDLEALEIKYAKLSLSIGAPKFT